MKLKLLQPDVQLFLILASLVTFHPAVAYAQLLQGSRSPAAWEAPAGQEPSLRSSTYLDSGTGLRVEELVEMALRLNAGATLGRHPERERAVSVHSAVS